MLYERIQKYLINQKYRMLEMDGATPDNDWLTESEDSGKHFSVLDETQGRRFGMMEILYDNTIKWIMSQSRKSLALEFLLLNQPGVISEDTTTANVSTFTTALLPAVRRIYSRLLSMEIASVQPLKGPTGYIYWMDHVFASDKAGDGITAGDRLDQKGKADQYTNAGEQDTIPEINFKLTKKLIETTSKKVKADWTLESEQDLQSQWGHDLESEILPQLTGQITREIDRLMVNAMYQGAGAGDVTWDPTPPAGDTGTSDKNAYYQTLYHAIAQANTNIFNKRYTNATFLLMNADTFYYFQRLNGFVSDPHAMNQTAGIQRNFVGTLNGLYKVYIDPWFVKDKILVGIGGQDWRYAGSYYAPYVPLFLSDKYILNDDFTQVCRGAMSRFALGVIGDSATQSPQESNSYATVTISSS